MNLDTRLIHDRVAIDALAAEWDALIRDDPHALDGQDGTMSFVWFDALRASFPVASAPSVVTCRSDGQLVGLLPVFMSRHRGWGSRLALPTELYGGRCGPLLHPDPGVAVEALAALLGCLERNGGHWSSLQLALVEGHGAERLRTVCKNLGWRWQEEAIPKSAGFPMPAPGTTLRDTLSANLQQNLRKAQNKAAKLSQPVRFRAFDSADAADELLQAVLHIERASWKHEAGSAITNHPQQQAFYAELFPRALRSGLLQAMVMYIGDEPVAHHFGLVRDGVFCCLKHSQAQAHQALSPSNLLMNEMLPRLAERGIQTFDWMGLVEEHKLRWSQASFLYQRCLFRLYRPGWTGRTESAVTSLGGYYKRTQREVAARLSKKKDTSVLTSSSPHELQCRVVTRGPALDAVKADWISLLPNSPPDKLIGLGSTNLPIWFEALAKSRQAAAAARVLLLEQQGRVHGLQPLIERGRDWLGVHLAGATELYGGRNGLIASESRPELAEALLRGLAAVEPKWTSVRWTVMSDSAGTQDLRNACARLNMGVREYPVPPSPYVLLGDDSETFMQGVSRSLQRNLRQSMRWANEHGELRWQVFQTPDQTDALMSVMLDIERNSWKHGAGSAVSSHPEQEAFYRALAPLAMQEGRLYALALFLNETPVSYQLGLCHGGVYSCLKNSMRADVPELRASYLLKIELFNRLRERGIRVVDLMGVVEPHKLVWAKHTPLYERVTLTIFRDSLAGRLALWGATLREAFGQVARKLSNRLPPQSEKADP